MPHPSSNRHSMNIWGASDCSLVRFDLAGGTELELDDAFHENFVLLAFDNCQWNSRNEDGSRTERSGDIVIRRPGERFSIRAEWIAKTGGICREIHVPAHRLTELVEDEESPFPRLDFGNGHFTDPELSRNFLSLHARFEEAHSSLEAFEATVALLKQASMHGAQPAPSARAKPCHIRIRRVADYLRAHLGDNLSLDDLARVADMNRFVLLRQFREAVGVTPHQFQRIHRVILAKRLLREGMPLAEIATACGFADQSHMTREFKRRTGITPSAFIPRGPQARGMPA